MQHESDGHQETHRGGDRHYRPQGQASAVAVTRTTQRCERSTRIRLAVHAASCIRSIEPGDIRSGYSPSQGKI
jgi:hypothetical protein